MNHPLTFTSEQTRQLVALAYHDELMDTLRYVERVLREDTMTHQGTTSRERDAFGLVCRILHRAECAEAGVSCDAPASENCHHPLPHCLTRRTA